MPATEDCLTISARFASGISPPSLPVVTVSAAKLNMLDARARAEAGINVLAMAGVALASLILPAQAADQNLGRNIAAACATCHGTNGTSAGGVPSISGLPQQALQAALREFRAGTRPATVMNQLAKGYTDAQIDAVAEFFAAQGPR